MMGNVELKKALEKEINFFIESIDKLDRISVDLPYISHKKTERVKRKIEEQFYDVLKEIKNKVKSLTNSLRFMDNLEWNSLTLAFFGETNAGKSTLIEAITGGNGKTIGDGRKDFTRSVSTYEFKRNIHIMDMPGIEGNEGKVKNEIWRAVKKAHIIFYVYPDNKEPERGTLEKIKKYLRRNAEVYSILNMRGIFPPQVLEKKRDTIETIRKRTDEHMKNTLGEIYKGSFIIHALFGFFGRAQTVPENLKSMYNSALKLYGSKETLLKYSGLEELLMFIENISIGKYNIKILWGNFRKFLSTQEEIISKLLNLKATVDKNLKEIRRDLDNFKRKFEREKRILERNIERIIQVETEVLENKFVSKLYEAIDEEYSESCIKSLINRTTEDFKNTLKRKFNKEVKYFKDKIKKDLEILYKKIDFMIKFKVDIDLKTVFEKLEYSFKEILKELTDVIFSLTSIFITFLANPIIGAILAIINIVRKIWDWFLGNPEEKKSKAKKEAKKKAKETVEKVRWEIRNKLKATYREIEKQLMEVISDIEAIDRSLMMLSHSLNPVIAELIKSNARTSLLFINEIDPDAKFAYIQTGLKEGTHVAVVTPNKEKLIFKLKQLDIEKVYIYTSMNNLIEDLALKEGEFFKRLSRLIQLSVST